MTFYRTFEQFLTETPLPDDWDKQIFTKKIPFEQQIEYALERSTKIGEGSSRIAFEIEYKGGPTILKIAKNDKGLAQNADEVVIMKKAKKELFDIIIPMIDYDATEDKPRWIHVEKAESARESKLCDLMNVPNLKTLCHAATKQPQERDRETYQEFIELFNDESPKNLAIANRYVNILTKLEDEYDINLIDFTRPANWGIYKGKPVLIDLGYTKYVSNNFYNKSVKRK